MPQFKHGRCIGASPELFHGWCLTRFTFRVELPLSTESQGIGARQIARMAHVMEARMGDGEVKAWHFLRENKKLGFDDGRLVRVGHTFRCDPYRLSLCEYGFHGSVNILDALKYAPGPVVCRVRLGGRIVKGNDKAVASERTVIAMADATYILHEFACWSAERSLRLLEHPDPRSIAAIDAKRKWLRGELSDEDLGAARDAAWDAARAAAWDAAWAAARDAARDAAWDAAWAAARDAQRRKLTRECNTLLRYREAS